MQFTGFFLSTAQDAGLEFWQTSSNAIITYQSVPKESVVKVVSVSGKRELFARQLTPRERPKVTLRPSWIFERSDTVSMPREIESNLQAWNSNPKSSESRKWPHEDIEQSIDLRVDGIPNDETDKDEQYMQRIAEQVQKLVVTKVILNDDSSQDNILVEKTEKRIHEAGHCELHEIQQRNNKVQCQRCYSYIEAGFQVCPCGGQLNMSEEMLSSIRQQFKQLIADAYMIFQGTRGARHGVQPWQKHHYISKGFMRKIHKKGIYTSILDRFQNDEVFHASQQQSILRTMPLHSYWNDTQRRIIFGTIRNTWRKAQ